jgi:hypothetical protein
MKMITLAAIAALGVAATLSGAHAQSDWYTTPNAFGGYNYNSYSGGPQGYTTPNAFGGYNYNSYSGGPQGYTTPNAFGGYTYHSY